MVREDELAKYLTKCPLCKSDVGLKIAGFFFRNKVECKSCGAKWKWKDSNRVLLERYSENGAGNFLLEVERPASFWNTLDLEHVNWERVPKPESTVLQSLVLEKGEEVLAGWNGVSLDGLSLSGSLVLTTQRLLWFERKEIVKGLLRRKSRISYHLVYSLVLENLLQILSSPAHKYLDTEQVEITDNQGKKHSYRLARMQEYPSGKPLVMKVIKERRNQIESERRKERIQVVLDFSSLKDYMEKGGLAMQTFRCPNCSAPVEFPEKGKTTTCAHCGSKIYARDIFEKIKELIG